MQVVFLGPSGSWPTPKRNVSAVAIKRGPEVILFDCGEGTQRQFMLSKLSFMQVSRVRVPLPRRPFPRAARHGAEHVDERTRGAPRGVRTAGHRAARSRAS